MKSVKLWHCLVPSCWQIHFSLWVMGSRIRGTKRLSLLVHLTSETYFFNLICCSLSLARNKLKFSVGSTVFSNVILCPSSVITSLLYCLPINFFGSRSTSLIRLCCWFNGSWSNALSFSVSSMEFRVLPWRLNVTLFWPRTWLRIWSCDFNIDSLSFSFFLAWLLL